MTTAEIHITLKDSLLDVQGATTLKALHQLGHDAVSDVRIGKYIVLQIDGSDDTALQEQLDSMCQQLLANPVIENYDIALSSDAEATGANNGEVSRREVGVPQRKSGTKKVSASTTTPKIEPVKSLGGVTVSEPFAVDYLSYTAMSTEEQLAVQELAWKKHEKWILNALKTTNAAWILCVGGNVIEQGDSLNTLPDEKRLDDIGTANDLIPWVFKRKPR